MKRWTLAAAAILSFGIASCGPSYKPDFDAACKKEGNPKNDCDVYREYSYRVQLGKEVGDNKWEVNYKVLPLNEVVKNVQGYVNDLKEWLNYQNPEMQQYSKVFNLRGWFEEQEKIFQSILVLVKADQLQHEFKEAIGEVSSWSYNNDGPGYDPTIFKTVNPIETFPFKSKFIEEAKANGTFQPIATDMIVHTRQYDHKEPDPSYPEDPNKFIWRPKQISLSVTKYKIMPHGEQPKDNYTDYVEGYRVIDGKQESVPALRAFMDSAHSKAIVLIDSDREGQDIGFGLPDSLEHMSEKEVLSDQVLARLFPDDENYKRIEPVKPPIRVEIAKVGAPIDPWEKSNDSKGWAAPSSYKVQPMALNYNVRIVFKKNKKKDSGEPPQNPHELLREVEYVVKEYTTNDDRYKASPGHVWEYYLPKAPYSEKVAKAEVQYNEDTKKVRFVFIDGTEDSKFVTPADNKVTGDKPRQIAYTQGDKRWLLKDEDGDGVYEKRRQIPEPQESVGRYDSYSSWGSQRDREEDNNDGMTMALPPAHKPEKQY